MECNYDKNKGCTNCNKKNYCIIKDENITLEKCQKKIIQLTKQKEQLIIDLKNYDKINKLLDIGHYRGQQNAEEKIIQTVSDVANYPPRDYLQEDLTDTIHELSLYQQKEVELLKQII